MRDRKANWGRWRHYPAVEAWKAVALSLDIDPDEVRYSGVSTELVFEEGPTFDLRLDMTCANWKAFGARGSAPDWKIDLAKFAAWAQAVWAGLPPELANLASKHNEQTANEKKTTDHSLSEQENPLGARERQTLLKIIAALAKHCKLDITHPSTAAQKIETWSIEAGARVAARTAEEHLKRIADVLDARGPKT